MFRVCREFFVGGVFRVCHDCSGYVVSFLLEECSGVCRECERVVQTKVLVN